MCQKEYNPVFQRAEGSDAKQLLNDVDTNMTDDDILKLAHRISWRYKKSSDENHSDTYTFNESCMLQFAKEISKAAYIQGSNDCYKSMSNVVVHVANKVI